MFVLATIGCAAAPSTPVLVAARAVLGLAVGASSVVVPVFLAELAPVHLRGRLVAQNELMLVGGQALAFVFNAGLATAFGHVAHVWRYMLVLATVPALALWIGMTVVPESPRWLAGQGRAEEARRALHRIREDAYSPREAEQVLELAARDGDRDRDRPCAGLLDLVRIPWIRRVFVLGLSMAVINQISGINAVQHYGVSVLQDSGFGGNGAFYANIVPRPRGVAAVALSMVLLRRVGMGVCAWLLWMMTFVVGLTLPPLTNALGVGWTVLVFVALQLVALVWVHRVVPETRDRSLEELGQHFRAVWACSGQWGLAHPTRAVPCPAVGCPLRRHGAPPPSVPVRPHQEEPVRVL